MKYVTIIDIAKALGISKSTVSRALAGDTHNVKPATMQLICETADRMGYQRNELAVNLRKQNTRNIGIIIPEVVTSFFMNFIQQAQRDLREQGYRVLIAVSNEDPEQERENLLMFEQCRDQCLPQKQTGRSLSKNHGWRYAHRLFRPGGWGTGGFAGPD